MSAYAIHWFRRDLRILDNQALSYAAQQRAGQVIPLFIVDDTLVGSPRVGPNRLAFLGDRLRTLHAELVQRGSGLLIAYGDPRDIIPALARTYQATLVTWERDTAPWARQRDKDVAQRVQDIGIEGKTFATLTIHHPGSIKSGAGTPYTVFTPYYRNWFRSLSLPATVDLPTLIRHPNQPTTPQWPSWPTTTIALPDSSAEYAHQRLREFASTAIARYTTGRDMLADAGTSRLSAHLRFGIISPHSVARFAHTQMDRHPATGDSRSGPEVWLSELAWRDFYHQILYHFPHVRSGAFRRDYDAVPWHNDPALFAAWCDGRTGYPIVDAAMRQLRTEGWMHNRARMIVSSFLTKDLLIDWRWGERYFMQHLIDGDTAANNGGWQWAAGTGTDAQPYFRIFNPTSQGQKFDPDGRYVKTYVPELRYVPTKYIHSPWLLKGSDMRQARIVIGSDYPLPIVDHATQRQAALTMYQVIKTPSTDA